MPVNILDSRIMNYSISNDWFFLLLLDTYAPQVIIKTRMTKPILRQNYSLLCNARGNPIPRLRWSKINEKLEYYPSTRQCKIVSRIFSVQHKYLNFTVHFLRHEMVHLQISIDSLFPIIDLNGCWRLYLSSVFSLCIKWRFTCFFLSHQMRKMPSIIRWLVFRLILIKRI